MILAALLAMQTPTRMLVEVPLPGASTVAFAAVAELPPLTVRERSILRVVLRAVSDQTQDYTGGQIFDLTLGGQAVHGSLMPDHARIEFQVVSGAMKLGAGLLDSLVNRAVLSQESLDAASDAIQSGEPRLWDVALDPRPWSTGRILRADAVGVYRRVFGQGRLSVAVGGGFSPGEAQRELADRVARWPLADQNRWQPLDSRDSVAPYVTPGLRWVELRSRLIPARDVSLGTQLLVASALGVGKGSTLHRIVRERERLSYRQEAFIWPEPGGWRLRLVVAQHGTSEALTPERFRTLVLEDVDAWTDRDVQRAMGMLEASKRNGVPWSPLVLDPRAIIGRDLADETLLSAYWPLKTGRTWNRDALLSGLRNIKVVELRDLARAAVQSAESIVGP